MTQWEHPRHKLEAINYSLVCLRRRLASIDSEIARGIHGATDIERAKILEAIRLGEKLLESDIESNKGET